MTSSTSSSEDPLRPGSLAFRQRESQLHRERMRRMRQSLARGGGNSAPPTPASSTPGPADRRASQQVPPPDRGPLMLASSPVPRARGAVGLSLSPAAQPDARPSPRPESRRSVTPAAKARVRESFGMHARPPRRSDIRAPGLGPSAKHPPLAESSSLSVAAAGPGSPPAAVKAPASVARSPPPGAPSPVQPPVGTGAGPGSVPFRPMFPPLSPSREPDASRPDRRSSAGPLRLSTAMLHDPPDVFAAQPLPRLSLSDLEQLLATGPAGTDGEDGGGGGGGGGDGSGPGSIHGPHHSHMLHPDDGRHDDLLDTGPLSADLLAARSTCDGASPLASGPFFPPQSAASPELRISISRLLSHAGPVVLSDLQAVMQTSSPDGQGTWCSNMALLLDWCAGEIGHLREQVLAAAACSLGRPPVPAPVDVSPSPAGLGIACNTAAPEADVHHTCQQESGGLRTELLETRRALQMATQRISQLERLRQTNYVSQSAWAEHCSQLSELLGSLKSISGTLDLGELYDKASDYLRTPDAKKPDQ
ncbi:hypothetical protein H696_02632 [Fonticula alba]|uniref:Uncharacterized protein n=1 Tax=Fonticula alba TaxID=691883 RepID=A0A058Z8P9_FONAL|nr:hypothetical protein H696_02632 [Fonticula alba]KCV70303.1 hypothetical protein H696_02632 [Fonticula alba]|eukprot:XP_009494819.1 hypothetical protein H696_02632 [Fonticula alba]